MPYPEIGSPYFYYTDTTAGNKHTRRATGKPDMARLAKNRSDFWLSKALIKEQKKKTLILSDWSAPVWPHYKLSSVRAQLSRLIDEGFKVYVWQDDGLLLLDENNIYRIDNENFRKKMLAPSYKAIQTKAAEYKLPVDTIQILDNPLINYLLDDAVDAPLSRETVSFTEVYRALSSRSEDTKLEQFFLSFEPKINLVQFDDYGKITNNPAFDKFSAIFRDVAADLDVKIRYLNLSSDSKLTPTQIQDRLDNFPDIKEINLCLTSISSKELSNIFNKLLSLKKIVLSLTKLTNDLLTIEEGALKLLEEINLSGSNISFENLIIILKAAPRLKIIHLPYNLLYQRELSTVVLLQSLPKDIEELLVSQEGKVSFDDYIGIMLNSAAHLKKISLNRFFFHEENIPSKKEIQKINTLADLEEIALIEVIISFQALKKFLEASPKLKKLNLSYSSVSPDVTSFGTETQKINTLADLEEIDLSNASIPNQCLQALLKASPKLKKLNLKKYCPIDAWIENKGLKLESLEEIDLSDSFISQQCLDDLTVYAINLKHLYVSHKNLIYLSGDLIRRLEERGVSVHIETPRSSPAAREISTLAHFKDPRSFKILTTSGLSIKLDADTKLNHNTTYNCSCIFYPKELATVSSYRLNMYQKLSLNESPHSLNDVFILSEEGALKLVEHLIKKSDKDLYASRAKRSSSIYGKHHITLTQEWQSLPSLSPSEVMTEYHLSTESDVCIKYSERDNLYYIKSNEAGSKEVDIDFLLDVPPEDQALPEKIQAKVEEYNSFGSGALDLSALTDRTGESYLDAIRKQRVGACRHRAVAFKAEMDALKIECRIVTNQCHAFVEVKGAASWIRCDLGGYPATLQIDIANEPQVEGNLKAPVFIEEHLTQQPAIDFALRTRYEEGLTTWERRASLTRGIKEFCQTCVNGILAKGLIECTTEEEVSDLHFALEAYCKQTHRAVYYINSAEDLVCASSYIQLNKDKTATLKKGPGGPLHEFLTDSALEKRVLIINYGAFSSEELVKFNSLLDEVRKADGTDIPDDTVIIGLINKDNETTIPGNDFYSRFGVNAVQTCPLSAEVLKQSRPLVDGLFKAETSGEAPYSINLYHSSDWKEHLLGSFVPKATGWVYEEGELQKAIASGRPIEIKNGLNEDKEYCRFWREGYQLGAFVWEGMSLPWPKKGIQGSEGYDWESLTKSLVVVTELGAEDFVAINPQNCSHLLSQYCVVEKKLVRTEGIIEEHKNKALKIYLTNFLSADEWARVLETCRSHNVRLELYLAPGISLPKELQKEGYFTPAVPEMEVWKASDNNTQIIESTDADTTIALLKESRVLDITECHDYQLLSCIEHKIIEPEGENPYFEFTQRTCALKEKLEAGETVVLKGAISQALADELAPFLLGRREGSKGRLIVVSQDTSALNYMPRQKHKVTPEQKKSCLAGDLSSIDAYLEQESLSQLKARLRNKEPWAGMIKHSAPTFDLSVLDELSADKTRAFIQGRKDAVNRVLEHQPYVFLSGLSGTGKTSFVLEQYANKKDECTLYQGEDQLKNWAQNKDDKSKILFIDEANLSDSEWSVFEGLYNEPPALLIDGTYQEITEKHKVIFAGNPVSYGDARKLASFFKRHGNAVLFEAMPCAMLYESVLKPVFEKTSLEERAKELSMPLLAVYQFLAERSTTDILISPRELQMMALLVVSHNKGAPEDKPLGLAKYFAYQVAKHLVPSGHKQAFEEQFNLDLKALSSRKIETPDFLITKSRAELTQQLSSFLALRESRVKGLNEAQKYGGLGGLILDGEPGIGKSKFVLELLHALGYEEQTHPSQIKSKPFYQMPVSMAQTEKEELLKKAFHQGAVVVIDEINSSPMMERLLNALLMGKTPDGESAKNPGFMIIGTQNPITMAGRRAPSTALARRLCTITVPPYLKEEMVEILGKKGMEPKEAQLLVDVYQEKLDYALKYNKEPAPTFRDVLRCSEQKIQSKEARLGIKHAEEGIRNHGFFHHPATSITLIPNPSPSRDKGADPANGLT